MDPYNRLVSDSDGYAMLGDVVFHHRHGPEELLVPPRVPTETVERFLHDKVKPGMAYEPVDRAGDIARFYHRTDAVKLFDAFLTHKEKTAEDVLVSISALRAIGNLGDEEHQKPAAEYYATLLTHPQFDAVVTPMIELVFHLSLVPGKSVADALNAQVTRLAAAEKDKQNPSPGLLVAERQAKALLPATLAARAARDKILAIKDPAAQAKPVARIYIGLDSTGVADWFKWSGFQLMTIVRIAGPAPAVAALKDAVAAVKPAEAEDFRNAAAGRGLKAIQFFDTRLTPEQSDALARTHTRRFQLEG